MRCTLIGAATAIALAGAASLAIAQQAPTDKDPAAQDRAPEGKGQRAPGASQQPRGTEAPTGKDQPKATERPDKDRPKATERPDKDRPKATERPDKDRPKATERPDKDRPKATERPDKDRPKAAEKKGDRVQVSEQQRSRVSERIRQTRVEMTRIDVDVNIGSRIPRSIRLHTLPAAIIEIAPAYRGYHYVVLESETIVIVDPQTYVVVDVISSGPRRADRPGRAQLTLSAEERRFILRNVSKRRTADVRVRLALGAEVPRRVELLSFPAEVVARVPEVQRYRYIVAEDDVVVVDPSDRGVVLVIDE